MDVFLITVTLTFFTLPSVSLTYKEITTSPLDRSFHAD